MIRKIKNNLKSLKEKESSLLSFVLELKEASKVNKVEFDNKEDKRKFNSRKDKGAVRLKDTQDFNGHLRQALTAKVFREDKENMTLRNQKNVVKYSISRTENNLTSLSNLSSFRNFNHSSSLSNASIKNYFKPVDQKPLKLAISSCKAEFYDEYNKKYVKMNKFQERDLEFTKSCILPKVKMMKVDNDVMTDNEQLCDAFSMMRSNLKETIKLVQENKDYLSKNLSKKITFVNGRR